jgi:hypothetical protein
LIRLLQTTRSERLPRTVTWQLSSECFKTSA